MGRRDLNYGFVHKGKHTILLNYKVVSNFGTTWLTKIHISCRNLLFYSVFIYLFIFIINVVIQNSLKV